MIHSTADSAVFSGQHSVMFSSYSLTCTVREANGVWPLYWHTYTFQHLFLISCVITIISHPYNCSILLLILHISSSIFLHLLTFSSLFSINIITSSCASVPYMPHILLIFCSNDDYDVLWGSAVLSAPLCAALLMCRSLH